MTYNKQTWINDDPSTPLSAARLTHMENGIEAGNTTPDGEIADRHVAVGAGISQNKIAGLTDALSGKQSTTGKNVANGYAGLDSDALIVAARLGTGAATSSTYLRGDRTWSTMPVGAGGSHDEIDARDHGVGPGVVDNTGPLEQAIAALPNTPGYDSARGRRIYLPGGVLSYSSQVECLSKACASFYGEGGKATWSSLGSTVLRYTGTGGTSAFRIGSCNGLSFTDIHFQYTNAGFTGYMLDTTRNTAEGGDTAFTSFRGCAFGGSEAAYLAAALVHGNSSHNTLFDNCMFMGAAKAFEGLPNSPNDFCNTVMFTNSCIFMMCPIAISNVDESLVVIGANVEGTNLGLWDGDSTIYRPLQHFYKDTRVAGVCEGFSFTGNWCGDTNDEDFTNLWFDPGNANWLGFNISGNAFLTGHKLIDFNGAGTDGVAIIGNNVAGPSSHNIGDPTGMYLGLTDATRIYARGNAWFPDIGT